MCPELLIRLDMTAKIVGRFVGPQNVKDLVKTRFYSFDVISVASYCKINGKLKKHKSLYPKSSFITYVFIFHHIYGPL